MNDQKNQNGNGGDRPEEAAAEGPPDDIRDIAPAGAEPDGEDEAPEKDAPPTYEELLSDVASLKDQLLRALAETENVRRRAERDKADLSKYAVANFAREVLGVADNLRRAVEAVDRDTVEGNGDLKNLYVGIEMTQKALEASYEQFGIRPIDAMGKKFDHNFHQAMFEVEDPGQPEGVVVREIQTGYMIHDRLLRPAMVGVSKSGPKPEAAPKPEAGPEAAGEEPGGGDGSAAASPAASPAAHEKQSDAADKEGDGGEAGADKEP